MFDFYLFDTMSGQLAEPIDVPNVSWTLSVSDCSLSTMRDKGTGEGEASGLTLPWEAVPGADRYARQRAVQPWRRGLVMMSGGVPVVAGAIGDRTDSWRDTSFDLVSPMQILESRLIVPEGTFGAGDGSTTTSSVRYDNLSLRAIACDLVRLATEAKPGGALPLELPYLGEAGPRSREYFGYNVQNNGCKKLLAEIANVLGGPDIQLRPEMDGPTRIRWRLVAGSEAEPLFLGAQPEPALTSFPGGGSLEDLKVSWASPTMRVYMTGSGQDQGTLCHLSEDLSLCERRDPWPLVEEASSDADLGTADLVAQHADARLAAVRTPICQLTGKVSAADATHAVRPGLCWPGEPVRLALEGYPSLPDGDYDLRLMQMSGDAGDMVQVTFDVMADPWEG